MMTGDDVQLVTFRVGRQEFAFDILQVERILRYSAPSPLPKAPGFLEGVLPYGDGAVPVIDLRKRFELEAVIREETRLMVLELEVVEVLRVESTSIAAPSPFVRGLAAVYISGLVTRGGRPLIILNARKLLSSSERLSLSELGAA